MPICKSLALSLALFGAAVAFAQQGAEPQTFNVGDYSLHLMPDGSFSVDYRKYCVVKAGPFSLNAKDWQVLYGGRASSSLDMGVEQEKGEVVIALTEDESGASKFFKETLRLSADMVAVDVTYEPGIEIPIVAFGVDLPENVYAGGQYQACLSNGGAKSGVLPTARQPNKALAFRLDGLSCLTKLLVKTKVGWIDFSLAGAKWSLGDSRNASWNPQAFGLWIQESGKAGERRTLSFTIRLAGQTP